VLGLVSRAERRHRDPIVTVMLAVAASQLGGDPRDQRRCPQPVDMLRRLELRGRLSELVSDHGLHETLDSDHFYPSIEAALADIARSEPGLPDSDGHDPV
jgi:hypothetical protein